MKALDALTEGLFDYAGLFPPAALSWDDALAESAAHKQMLKRPSIVGSEFVITPDMMDHLEATTMQNNGFSRGDYVRVCLVGIPPERATELARVVLAVNGVGRFEAVPHEYVAFELQTPVTTIEETASWLMPARFVLQATEIQTYWEPHLGDVEWNERFDDIIAILDAANGEAELPITGLKVRCGGPNALSPATLARILPEVSRRNIPFKATQGLHHPLVNAEHGNAVGFIGLATALRLHKEGALDDADLQACITEDDPSAFEFDDGLGWRGHSIDFGQLGQALTTRFNIGSCSIHEPDAELDQIWP